MLHNYRTFIHVFLQERILLKNRDDNINHVQHILSFILYLSMHSGKDCVKYFRPTRKHFLQASKVVISQQRNSWPAQRSSLIR
jgi:hypothetical protein